MLPCSLVYILKYSVLSKRKGLCWCDFSSGFDSVSAILGESCKPEEISFLVPSEHKSLLTFRFQDL